MMTSILIHFVFFFAGALSLALLKPLRGKSDKPEPPPRACITIGADSAETRAIHAAITAGETVLIRVRPLKVVSMFDIDGDHKTGIFEFHIFDVMEDDGRGE